MISVLLAAARPTARAGLAAVLRAAPGITVVGEAAGTRNLQALAASLHPDVVENPKIEYIKQKLKKS